MHATYYVLREILFSQLTLRCNKVPNLIAKLYEVYNAISTHLSQASYKWDINKPNISGDADDIL